MTTTERATVQAVVHQLELGEASDLLDRVGPPSTAAQFADAQRDLRWCRGQLQKLLRATEPKP